VHYPPYSNGKVSGTANLDVAIRALDIAMAVGRYLLPMTIAFALLSAAAAVNSYSTGNIAGTAFWAALALVGAVFAGQVIAKRREHRISRQRKLRTTPRYTRAAQA
jgi:hypothetical protein